ncbi:uncharacterized protein DUF3892 [Mucilaginibacter oryzae]|uniref:Uncharacterized protein DUF3892 n=1 Tax=Mucilaginibacter oryzae TaxID=468058 RepID=A0A316HKH4_9SPHI|nr:DUF3892 domain-containing protein [Mucilaginibacter oryzae]PWK80511.1 uncharacterized protein DUF3892 [Mucilaginibacter oryzae]
MTKGYLVVGIILKDGSKHEHITYLVCWNPSTKATNAVSVNYVISDIKSGSYYFTHYNNTTANVDVSSRNGVEYVKTDPDGSINDNLLKLPVYSLAS